MSREEVEGIAIKSLKVFIEEIPNNPRLAELIAHLDNLDRISEKTSELCKHLISKKDQLKQWKKWQR